MIKIKNSYVVSLIPEQEVLVHSYEEAVALSKILMDNGNVVMLSMEEGNYIVSWIWSDSSFDSGEPNRNDVVFMHRDDYEMLQTNEAILPSDIDWLVNGE